MILMTAFLLKEWTKAAKINSNQFVGFTIVSTSMMAYEVACKRGLIGFK
jgi:phosphoglucomutase